MQSNAVHRLVAASCAVVTLLLSMPRAAASSPVDAAWDAYAAAAAAQATPLPGKPFTRAWLLESAAIDQRVRAAGATFLDLAPSDPRRWQVMQALLERGHMFIQEIKPEYDDFLPPTEADAGTLKQLQEKRTAAIVRDYTETVAWERRASEMRVEIVQRDDAPVELKAMATSLDIERRVGGALRRTFHGEANPFPDRAEVRRRIEEQLARFPAAKITAQQVQHFMMVITQLGDGAETEQCWRAFAGSPNQAARELAKEELRQSAEWRDVGTVRFTAVDGREVDLAKLRGKVVLVDFWATWCGPCRAELPNVKRVYAAYHDRGFEVVGITLEDARLAPDDTPEQAAAKLAKSKAALLEAIAREDLAWPQSFDGRIWDGDLAKRFGIRGIPAMFLLDQQGRVVSTNARGATLEREVKRLLAEPAGA